MITESDSLLIGECLDVVHNQRSAFTSNQDRQSQSRCRCSDHSNATVGRRARSRTRRSMHALARLFVRLARHAFPERRELRIRLRAKPLHRLCIAARTCGVDQAARRARAAAPAAARARPRAAPWRRLARRPAPARRRRWRRPASDPRRRAARSSARPRARGAREARRGARCAAGSRHPRAGMSPPARSGGTAAGERRRRGATRRTRRARPLRRTRCARDDAAALGVVALEVAIDAATRHLERHAARRPAADLLERGPDDANQVAVVLAAEIRLDLPAVLRQVAFRDWGWELGVA